MFDKVKIHNHNATTTQEKLLVTLWCLFFLVRSFLQNRASESFLESPLSSPSARDDLGYNRVWFEPLPLRGLGPCQMWVSSPCCIRLLQSCPAPVVSTVSLSASGHCVASHLSFRPCHPATQETSLATSLHGHSFLPHYWCPACLSPSWYLLSQGPSPRIWRSV